MNLIMIDQAKRQRELGLRTTIQIKITATLIVIVVLSLITSFYSENSIAVTNNTMSNLSPDSLVDQWGEE